MLTDFGKAINFCHFLTSNSGYVLNYGCLMKHSSKLCSCDALGNRCRVIERLF